MPRYVAFLRGVSPMNLKMADLKACFEKMGFTDVRTVLSSGNVVFTADCAGVKKSEADLTLAIEDRHAPPKQKLLVVFAAVPAPEPQHRLIPAAAGFNVIYGNKRLWLHGMPNG